MLKEKILSMFKVNQKSIQDYAEYKGVSRQALYTTINKESLSLRELCAMAEYLGMKVALESPDFKVVIESSDFTPKSDGRHARWQKNDVLKPSEPRKHLD